MNDHGSSAEQIHVPARPVLMMCNNPFLYKCSILMLQLTAMHTHNGRTDLMTNAECL